ncbi:conserved exported hypothetical protein [Candidatus Sulfopaludibacter sp. SbA4]|nr:conserved exported hypothetical protein [Candidatus Sulfopaludibacter sp. SbA4]
MRRDLGVFILSACATFAQPPARLVTLDIAATGAHGQAVPDLRSSDIQLSDNKKTQSIVYWHSNQRRPEVPRATVVVFSLENAGIKSAAWNQAIGAMRRFEISEYLYFYVVTNSGALLPVHALPKPEADSPPVNLPWMAQTLPQFESASHLYPPPRKSNVVSYSPYMEFAARLAAFPGRKNLVCIGCLLSNPGWWDQDTKPASAAQVARAAELRRLAGAFHQARVAVYPVDGLAKPRYLASEVGETADLIRLDHIDALAAVTGGRAYAHGEIEQAIAQAVSDARSSYRIAYLPSPENWDGKVHQIRVVSTRSGVHVLAPTWYVADLLEDVARKWKPTIPDFAISSPFDQSDIAVSVAPPEKTANAFRIQVRVDAADLLLLPKDGHSSGSLALQAICYTPEGRKLACTEPLHVDLDLSDRQRETAMRGGLRFPMDLPAGEVPARIRVVVCDLNSGATGSSTFVVQEAH